MATMGLTDQRVHEDLVDAYLALEGIEETSSDGRHARREANRNRVIAALLDLTAEGHAWPNVSQIAMRAEVSERSIFRYFDDMDDLAQTAFDTRLRDAFPYSVISRPWPADPGARLELLVETRANLFEFITPVASVSRSQVNQSPVLARSLKKVRELLRTQIAILFEEELESLEGDRDQVLFALDVVFAFESWFLIRSDQERTVEEAKDVLALTGRRLLELA
jgi:AcrR family transcriptional regulator